MSQWLLSNNHYQVQIQIINQELRLSNVSKMSEEAFSNTLSWKTPILTISHGQDYLWESLGVLQIIPAHCWSKKLKTGWMKRVRWIVLYYLHHPFHKAGQLSANRNVLGLQFVPQRKTRAHEWAPAFPSSGPCCQRGSLLSHFIQNSEESFMAEGQVEVGRG